MSEHESLITLIHQLRGPLAEASRRIDKICIQEKGTEQCSSRAINDAHKVRALLRKAHRLLFGASLANRIETEPSMLIRCATRVDGKSLLRVVNEIAIENERLSPRNSVSIEVDSDSFNAAGEFVFDIQILEHVLYNVIDNAIKYSFRGTSVRVGCAIADGSIHLHVRNSGVVLTREDAQECKKRGWRGSVSRLIEVDGTGTGLWVCDHFMRAHGGDLVVLPTDDSGVTSVTLVIRR